ncbi:MAG: winged helix-turn-helix domain-containing protein [Psychrobium sp.]
MTIKLIGNEVKSVEPKAMAVLQVLVEVNRNVVTQQEVVNRAPKDVVVAPNALQWCIAQLRKVFNNDAKVQSIIKTDMAHPVYLFNHRL